MGRGLWGIGTVDHRTAEAAHATRWSQASTERAGTHSTCAKQSPQTMGPGHLAASGLVALQKWPKAVAYPSWGLCLTWGMACC